MIGSKGLHRGNETIGSMSESRFKEAYLEEYDVQDKAWCRRNRAYLLMLHVAVVLVLPRAWRQDEPARVLRDESWRRGWAVEVARREQQREQQREALEGAAAAVAAAAAATVVEAEANALERVMAGGGEGRDGGAASAPEASKAAEVSTNACARPLRRLRDQEFEAALGSSSRIRLPNHCRDHDRPGLHIGRFHLRAHGHYGVAPHQ